MTRLESLPFTHCHWCHGEARDGTTCPHSIMCPACKAAPGKRCMRPSGHEASELHADRYHIAERIDRGRGIQYPGDPEWRQRELGIRPSGKRILETGEQETEDSE